jgi:hypothetical protein
MAVVERQRYVIVGLLHVFDEIGAMVGTGNRSDDGCGDNAQPEGERRGKHEAMRCGKAADTPSQGCFFGYNRANSRSMIRPVGVSTNVGSRSQGP